MPTYTGTVLNTANFDGTNGSHFRIVESYEISQSITNNTSTITAYLYMESIDYYYGSGSTCTGYLNGSSVGTFSSISAGASILVGSKIFTVAHNTNGTATWDYTAKVDTNWSLGDAELSGTLTLPTIARASSLAVGSTSINIQNTTGTLSYTITSLGDFYHTLHWKVGTSGTETQILSNQRINTATYSGTLAYSAILAKFPNTTTGKIYLILRTYSTSSHTTQVGSDASKAVTISIDTTKIKPTITLSSITADSGDLSGKLVAGYSIAKVTSTASLGNTGAGSVTTTLQISKGSLATNTVSGTNATVVKTKKLKADTANYTFTITATATDSRGAQATATKTSGTVYGYAKPIITAKFYRTATNSSTAADPAGLYVYRSFSATQTYTVGGSNSVTVSAKQNGTTVTSGTWGSLADDQTATLIVTATDSVSTVTKTLSVSTAKFPLDLYDSGTGTVGVGLGATAIADRVRSAMSLLFNNNTGVKGYDTNGNEVYVAIYNASNNLWIGARTNGMTHFTGKTYICTGYDGTNNTGNDSAYLAIPNAANDNVTYSKILHETFAPIAGYMTQNSWASGSNDADNAPNGSVWCNCQYVDHLPYTSGYGFLVTIANNLQFFVRYSNSGASGLHIRYYTNSQWYQWQQVSGGSSPSYTNGDEVSY